MEIQEKHYNTILKAKCEVVCMAENLLKKNDYGDDIECCSRKLFAAISLINRLDCYCFEETPLVPVNVDAIFRLIFNGTNSLPPGTFASIKVDGVQVYSFYTDDELDEVAILKLLFEALGIEYQYTVLPNTSDRFLIQLKCFNESVSTTVTNGSDDVTYDFDNVIAGECSVPSCFNCINDSDLNAMYEVLDGLLK